MNRSRNKTSFRSGIEHPNWKGGTSLEQVKERSHLLYLQNREQRLVKARAYYYLHRKEKIEYAGKYQKMNKDKKKVWGKRYRDNNQEKIRVYHIKNKDRLYTAVRIRSKIRRRTDVQYKLKCQIRHRINMALKSNFKSGSAVMSLGCTISELKFYIEGKFQEGMSWNNWSNNGWHLDHVIPLAFFNLSKKEQFLQACHYTNLQPMWAKENILKSNKLVYEIV